MKAALIPPIAGLPRFGRGNFHLLLTHLLKSKKYQKHYEEQRAHGAYLVLDNSAHEFGAGDDPEALIWNALALKAQEVVVPDVLDDGPATVDRAVEALELWFEKRFSVIKREMPALMYVPQGASEGEWAQCLYDLVDLHKFISKRHAYRKDFVLGLSKDYEVWLGGLMHLIDNYILPMRSRESFQLHLLGWGRDLWALEEIARKHPWIRSTDSAKPFVYALKGMMLNPEEPAPMYPGRPGNYFNRRLNEEQEMIATANSMMFRAIATGHRTATVMV